jgi:rare lipoprotein A
VERGVERVLLAKLGAFLLAGALIAPAWVSTVSARASSVIVATALDARVEAASTIDPNATTELSEQLPQTVLGAIATASSLVEETPVDLAAPPPPEPLVTDGVVTASWYGPGFYGNRTACGQAFSAEIVGVAHRTLPCGTKIRLTSPSGVTLVAPVIDRGPFVAGRSLDLSHALREALRCGDLCSVRMVVLEK